MATKTLPAPVTMRVKIGDVELEVSGPPEFVVERVAEFETKHSGKRDKTPRALAAEETPSEGAGHKPSTLAQLFKKVTVKSDVDRVLVAGYFLETAKEAQSFTAAEIKDAIRAAKVAPPTNPSDVIAKNIKKGLMMQAGDRDGKLAYVLTTDGIEFVAEQLKA